MTKEGRGNDEGTAIFTKGVSNRCTPGERMKGRIAVLDQLESLELKRHLLLGIPSSRLFALVQAAARTPHRRAGGLTPLACRVPLKGGVIGSEDQH